MGRIILASVAFKNRAPNSVSAADAATRLRIVHCVSIASFNLMGHLSLGIDPKKKWPPALLLALGAVK